MSSSLLEG